MSTECQSTWPFGVKASRSFLSQRAFCRFGGGGGNGGDLGSSISKFL